MRWLWFLQQSVELLNTVSQKRFVNMDLDVFGELNFDWYNSSAFLIPSSRKVISFLNESNAKKMSCSTTTQSICMLPTSKQATISWNSWCSNWSSPSPRSLSPFHSPLVDCWRTALMSHASAFSQKRPSGLVFFRFLSAANCKEF